MLRMWLAHSACGARREINLLVSEVSAKMSHPQISQITQNNPTEDLGSSLTNDFGTQCFSLSV
jgi:hypothetical protein